MNLTELFKKSPVKWEWSYKGENEADAIFMAGELQYRFYAFRAGMTPEGINRWEVQFGIDPFHGKRDRFGVTGTGNAAIVMSAVVAILRDFVKEYEGKVNQLVFDAKERSRRDLYAAMVRRLLPTWKFEQSGRDFRLTAPDVANT